MKGQSTQFVQYLSVGSTLQTLITNQEKIKSIFNSHVYNNKLCFVNLGKIKVQHQSDIVLSNETDLSEAVKHGYLLECSDKIWDISILLHKMIKHALENK